MARAKRHYLPGYAWHITHRCHKRELLLKFAKDRRRWLRWLFEAKKRYGLCILNYTVTCNHVHLLVLDCGERDVIPRSVQLVAGRTGQEYNRRKGRKGAFWEDRYHATAVETNEHLARCIVYMDLNMVRAGVVGHPGEWSECGFEEMRRPRERYTLTDCRRLAELLGLSSPDALRSCREGWVEERLGSGKIVRDGIWTESVAVGSEGFVAKVKERLGSRAKGRRIDEADEAFQLREPAFPYAGVSGGENGPLSLENLYFWNICRVESDG